MSPARRSDSTDDARPADLGADVEVPDADPPGGDRGPAEPPVDEAPGEQAAS